MAASELNQRLDYLISYSSQLVFVCSDKIHSPTHVIEDYLSNQQEQADLAILTANELTPLAIYREKLFRQLINQTQATDFNRPLNQLLAGLNHQQGPIVISIFQAEKLPNKLVKELWDLVLQSRFAKNKQQLNILLVGQSAWAEQVKNRLATKSKEQPIILSNDNLQRQTIQPEMSELDSLIQDNRKKFAQRIQARRATTYYTQPIFKKWWVNLLLGLVFLGIFAGMLSWQYPDKLQAVLSVVSQQINQKPTQTAKLGSAPPQLTISPVNLTEDLAQQEMLATDKVAELDEITEIELLVANKPTNNELITDWTTASAKLAQRTEKILANDNQIVTESAEPEPVAAQLEPQVSANTETVQVGQLTKPNLTDYAVEDKYQPVLATNLPTEINVNAEPVVNNQGLTLNNDMIRTLNDSDFVIQIAAMANQSILQEYIMDEQLSDQLWIYKTQRYGADWYVLLTNQAYATIQAARAEIANLPPAMLRNTPFVKSLQQVKQEIPASIR